MDNEIKNEYLNSKFDSVLDTLEENHNKKETVILALMFSLHSLSNELDNLKKSLPVKPPRRLLNLESKNLADLNNDKLNSSVMSRRSISRSRMLNKDKENSVKNVKDKFGVLSPKVSINIGLGGDKQTEPNRRNVKSIEKDKLNAKVYTKRNLNTISASSTSNTINTKSNSNKQLKAHSSAKKLSESKGKHNQSDNDNLKITPKRDREMHSKVNKDFLSHTTGANKNGMKKMLQEGASAHQNKVSFKFEPKKRTSTANKEISQNPYNPFEVSNMKVSFKSEENKDKETSLAQTHSRANSDNCNSNNGFKPKQLFKDDSDNKIETFLTCSLPNHENVFKHIFSFLTVNNKLKNVNRLLRNAFLNLNIGRIAEIKVSKRKALEEDNNNINSNLESILELEILTHREEKMKSLLVIS